MSGPKLSAYELEQRRKKELERIQQEIIRLKTLAMQDIQEAQLGRCWCEEESGQLNLQEQYLNNTSLPGRDKERIRDSISHRKAMLEELKQNYSSSLFRITGTALDDVKREQATISSFMTRCREQLADYEEGRANYEASLSVVAENLKRTLQAQEISTEQSMMDLPCSAVESVSGGEEELALTEAKNELRRQADSILKNPNSGSSDKRRASNAKRRLEQIHDKRELHELRSAVLNEIERGIEKKAPYLKQYHQLLAKLNSLILSLGAGNQETPMEFEELEVLKLHIKGMEERIQSLETELMQKAEHNEIARCIEQAMNELGYKTIGEKPSLTSPSKIKLYEFNGSSGLQIQEQRNGTIRIQVVGLADGQKIPDDAEKDCLLNDQVEFCGKYDNILEAFRRKGVVAVQGTQERRPPRDRYCQFVDVKEYNPDYVLPDAAVTRSSSGKGDSRKKYLILS